MAFGSNGGAKSGCVLFVGEDPATASTLSAWLDGKGIPSHAISWGSLSQHRMVPGAYELLVVDLRVPQSEWISRLGRVDPAGTVLLVSRETEQLFTGSYPPESFHYVPMPSGKARFLASIQHALEFQRMNHRMNEAQVELDGRPLWEIEREVVEKTIRQCSGSIPAAARRLGVSPSTLYRKREAWARRQKTELPRKAAL